MQLDPEHLAAVMAAPEIARQREAERAARDDENCSDVGNARRLVATYGARFRHVPGLEWFAWDGTRWERDTAGKVYEAAKDVARDLYTAAGEHPDPDRRKQLAKWALQSEQAPKIRAIVELARTDQRLVATVDQLDADPYLLNTPTGTVALRTGTLRPHSPTDLITKITGCGYDPTAPAPTWDAFLHQIMRGRAELVDYLQRLIGYALIGETLENVLALFVGMGANGKSTLLNALLDMAGDYGGTAEPDLLIAKRNDSHPTGVADLRGRRIVVAMESSKNRRLDEAVAKRLTGGDRIKARVMRGDFFEFTPTHSIIMATNDRPGVSDTTEGTWRRLRLVPFDVAIAPGDQDHQLPAKLRAELPGILAWAVIGTQRYLADGLGAPAAVTLATDDYRDEQNIVGRWIEDYVAEWGEGWKPAADMFANFRSWADRAGEDPGNQTAFGRELKRRGFTSDRHTIQGKSVRAWQLKGVVKESPGDDFDGSDTGSGSPPNNSPWGTHTDNASNASGVNTRELL